MKSIFMIIYLSTENPVEKMTYLLELWSIRYPDFREGMPVGKSIARFRSAICTRRWGRTSWSCSRRQYLPDMYIHPGVMGRLCSQPHI
jgi:hypothetical protein